MTVLSARLKCIAAERRLAATRPSTSAAKRIVTAKIERTPLLSPVRVVLAVVVGVPVVIAILVACGVA